MKTDYAKAYGEMHQSEKRFPGYSIKAYLDAIAALVDTHKPERMCDVGCGKGYGYTKRRYHDAWGGLMPSLYDIGVPEFSRKPEGQFGGVLCTDVMEHIEMLDVPAMLDELIGYVAIGGFLFLGISCRPTRKTLPDGRDVHLTIQAPEWWIEQIYAAQVRNPASDSHIVAHWDVVGHFICDETPFDNWSHEG